MKKLSLLAFSCFLLSLVSCSSEPKQLNSQETKSVEDQVKKDKAAMDSLEKAIQDQINGMDTVSSR